MSGTESRVKQIILCDYSVTAVNAGPYGLGLLIVQYVTLPFVPTVVLLCPPAGGGEWGGRVDRMGPLSAG